MCIFLVETFGGNKNFEATHHNTGREMLSGKCMHLSGAIKRVSSAHSAEAVDRIKNTQNRRWK